jgi:antitoxin (DNA-binding transcriptional repressor) of toxin-antitoxin stability system
MKTMQVYSVEHWQENWEELMDRVEDGEHIGVTNGKNTAIMMPADDELIRMYTDHEEGS